MAIERITVPVARKMVGMTQKDLADYCNVSETTIRSWEKFRTEPSISQAKRIAEAVGRHYDELIFLPQDTV